MIENLKKETLKAIKSLGYKPDDIKYILDANTEELIMKDTFWKLADFDYTIDRDNYKCTKVNDNLVIEFRDGTRLERDKNSCQESWVYRMTKYDKCIVNIQDAVGVVWSYYPDGIHELLEKETK